MNLALLAVIFVLLLALLVFLWGVWAMRRWGGRVVPRGVDCDSACGSRVCDEYRDRLRGFGECMRCRRMGMCWSEPQGTCVECSGVRDSPCWSQDQFGCQNPRGYMLPDVPPINPAVTGCNKCW